MSSDVAQDRFWAEGLGRLMSALGREERAALEQLEREMRETEDPARLAELLRAREDLLADYGRRRREAVGSLFLERSDRRPLVAGEREEGKS